LLNLSISDLLMAIFSIPFTYTIFMLGRWIFPKFLCPCVQFAQLCSVFVSIYTLTAIGIDRYALLCLLCHSYESLSFKKLDVFLTS
jgi:hypothetical protein